MNYKYIAVFFLSGFYVVGVSRNRVRNGGARSPFRLNVDGSTADF